MALLFSHRLAIGVSGYGGESESDDGLSFGHGGVIVRYHFPFESSPLYLSLGALSAAGAASEGSGDGTPSEDNQDSDAVFVFEPQVSGHLNVTRWLRLGADVGYRLVAGSTRSPAPWACEAGLAAFGSSAERARSAVTWPSRSPRSRRTRTRPSCAALRRGMQVARCRPAAVLALVDAAVAERPGTLTFQSRCASRIGISLADASSAPWPLLLLRSPRVMPALGLLGALGLSGCDNPRTTDGEPPNADALDAMACASGPERNGPYTRVTVAGEDAALGIIDPSVDYAVAASSGLMTYTAVPSFSEVHIAIASSDDAGLSWRHVSDVTESRPLTISTDDMAICGSSSCDGTLAHESSSLIVDAFDPDPNRRLKVFAHSYFFGLERQLELGYLALYTAARPEGPWTETPLLGWPSSSTVTSTPVAHDISSDPSLQQLRDCLIIGEPGALVRAPGTIDLALACVRPEAGSATIDIRLLRSLDHAMTWTYVGTLLSPEDAQSLGATSRQINGADLFYADDAYHLIATPIGLVDFPDGRAEGYRGCVVVPITDLDAGQIARCNEEPIVEASYLGQPRQFVGACSADAGSSASSLFIPVPDLASAQPFQLFAAQMSLP